MSKKMGRPAIPRNQLQSVAVGIRVTADERKILGDKAKEAQLNVSDYILQQLFGKNRSDKD